MHNRPIPGRPISVTHEENQLQIAVAFVENRHFTIRSASREHDISRSSVHRILKENLKFHPYKLHLVQKLNEDDPDR